MLTLSVEYAVVCNCRSTLVWRMHSENGGSVCTVPEGEQEKPQAEMNEKGQRPHRLTKQQKLSMVVLACCAFVVVGLLIGLLGPALPGLAERLRCPKTRLAPAFTLRAVGYTVGSFSPSYLERHLTLAQILSIGLLLSGGMTLIVALKTEIWVLMTVIFFQGFGLGTNLTLHSVALWVLCARMTPPRGSADVAGNVMLLKTWGKGRSVGPYMQALHSAYSLGAVVSPAIVGAVGFFAACITCAVFTVLPVVGLWLARGFSIGSFDQSDLSPSREWLTGSTLNADDSENGYLEDHEDTGGGSGSSSSRGALMASWALSGLIGVFLFLNAGIEHTYAAWLTTVCLDEGLVSSNRRAAWPVSLFWGSITIGRLVSIPVAVRVRPSRFLLAQVLVMTMGGVLLVTIGSMSFLSTTISSVSHGLGMSSIYPTCLLLPGDLGLPVSTHPTSLLVAAATLGEALIALAVGHMIKNHGVHAFAWSIVAAVIVMSPLMLIIVSARGLASLCCRSGT